MKVLNYKSILPDKNFRVSTLDRNGYMTPQYINMVEDYLSSIELTKPTAFLYSAGAVCNASEARNIETIKDNIPEPIKTSTILIKELSAYSMHKWIGCLKGKENITYANINGNTCASSMYSLYEAQQLFKQGIVEEVIIVAEEKTSYNTLRIFDEHKIGLDVGEGIAIIRLSKNGNDITNCKWSYEYNRNPFGVTPEGYSKVYSDSDYVNPHGTGTTVNEEAENKVFGNTKQLRYKEGIGHTQGASGLIEVCKVLSDDTIKGNILCVASGLSGFYGSCLINKE